jgi:hypothetical protein
VSTVGGISGINFMKRRDNNQQVVGTGDETSTCLLLRREFWEQRLFITAGVLGAALIPFGGSFGSSTCLLLRREFWEQHVFIIKEGVLGAARVYY